METLYVIMYLLTQTKRWSIVLLKLYKVGIYYIQAESERKQRYLDYIIEDEMSQNKNCILPNLSVFVI